MMSRQRPSRRRHFLSSCVGRAGGLGRCASNVRDAFVHEGHGLEAVSLVVHFVKVQSLANVHEGLGERNEVRARFGGHHDVGEDRVEGATGLHGALGKPGHTRRCLDFAKEVLPLFRGRPHRNATR